MPIYQYHCDCCKHGADEFQKMSSLPLDKCPVCHQKTYRRIPTLPHTDLKEFHTPIEMHSIAMEDPHEIKDFIRKSGVEVCLDPASPSYGIPIARNRSEKCKALAAAGFEERS